MTPAPTAIAVVGLGYVGLPLTIGFGRKFPTMAMTSQQKR